MILLTPGSQATFLFQILGSPLQTSVVGFTASEKISDTFQLDVQLATTEEIESFASIVGQEALLTILNDSVLLDGAARYFHGIIRRMEQTGMDGDYYLYRAEVVPTLWRFTLRKNCRIFQETTTQEIVKTLLEEGGITADRYRFALTNKNRPRGFCVQYRESDFDFISRLLEEEGIFYFFEHYQDKHVMILGDAPLVHVPLNGGERITFNPNGGMVAAEESIHAFSFSERLRPDSFTHRNFFFKQPSLDLTAQRKKESGQQFEVYDYPALHVDPEQGNYLAKVRLEEQNVQKTKGDGHSSVRRLTAGYKFTLDAHPTRGLNVEYLIVSVTHSGQQPQSLNEKATDGFKYGNSFTVIPASVPFRPRITTEKPVVQGLQTAIVVGPKGEEIHTDRYGRVKVQFHWDREGQRNENSSCWLRSAQGWGGGGWGMVFTPRVGDEVLVDFLEGNPDRPLIVGSVYNEENLPLYELPANKTVSTIKTKSYPNDSGFNELRFEDKKGSEEIYLHGQKDWTIGIENDKNQTVGHDETLSVANNREKHVGVDQMVTVGANHTETVGANKTISVGSNKTETVGINAMETIGLAKELTIGGLYQVSVGGAMNETVAGAKAEEVGITKAVLVGAHMTEKVIGNRSITVGQNFSTTVSQTSTLKAKSIIFEADDEIVLKTGNSLISMKSSGDIVVSGGTIQTKGSGDVIIKGAKISEN